VVYWLASTPDVLLAGPNSNGTLIVHAAEQITSSADLSGHDVMLSACEDALVSVPVDPLSRTVCSVFAAFPPGTSVAYASASFGIDYDPAAVEVLEHVALADLEITAVTWPAPEQGVVLIWDGPRVEPFREVYRFLVHAEAAGELALIPHPSDGGRFGVQGDETWEFDPVAGYGRLGFGVPGHLPCPEPEPSPLVEVSWGWIKWNAARPPHAW
jgi:hypothetical protein